MQLVLTTYPLRSALWTRCRAISPWALALAMGDATGSPADHRGSEVGANAQVEVDAFEAFFRAREHAVFGFLWRMSGDEQAAGDLTQETFLRAWQQCAKIRDYDRPDAWLLHVATRLALNHLRFRSVTSRVSSTLFADARPTVGDPARAVAEQDTVHRALLRLSPRKRASLVLHSVAGFSCADLAQALGISLSATKVTLWRARDHFRTAYLNEEGTDGD